MQANVGAVALCILLAGCASPSHLDQGDSAHEALASLSWPTLTVFTTPSEAQELTGPIQVTWMGGFFSVWAARESDLDRRTIVQGDTVYANNVPGMGWTQYSLADGLAKSRLSNRLVLWDLPLILADPELVVRANATGTTLNLTAEGHSPLGGGLDVRVELGAVDNKVVWVRESSLQGRESPYTFIADGTPFPFIPSVPPAPLPAAEAAADDARAQAAHSDVIELLDTYARNHGNTVPDEPSRTTLAVELVASGKAWPNNVFDGQPLEVGQGPGDIGWKKCGLGDATYTGWGWDGALVTQQYGRGCVAAGP